MIKLLMLMFTLYRPTDRRTDKQTGSLIEKLRV